MSIFLKNNIYWVDCRPDGSTGRRLRLPIGTQQEAIEAEKVFMDAGRKRRAGVNNSITDYTIKALWPRYFDHQRTNFDSEATHANIEDSGQNILRYIGNFNVLSISNEVPEYLKKCLKGVISGLTKKPLANSTINKHLIWLSGFLKYCREVLEIPVPVIKIRKLKVERRLPVTLTPDEARRFILSCPHFFKCLFGFLYLCGLCSDEARNIKWTDIECDMVTVIGKGNKQRSVPVPDWLLDQILLLPQGNEYVFYNPASGKPFHNFGASLTRLLKECGIDKKITPHGLRHSFGGNSIQAGVNVAVLQAFLGHAKVTTTQLYIQIAQKSLKDASNRVMDITGLVQLKEICVGPICPTDKDAKPS